MKPVEICERFVSRANRELSGAEAFLDGPGAVDLIHPEYVLYENGELALEGADQVAGRLEALKAGAPAFRQQITHSITEGDVTVVRWRMEGLPADEGSSTTEATGISWVRVADDRIVEVHQWWSSPAVERIVRDAATDDGGDPL